MRRDILTPSSLHSRGTVASAQFLRHAKEHLYTCLARFPQKISGFFFWLKKDDEVCKEHRSARVVAQSLVSTSYSSHPDRSLAHTHFMECFLYSMLSDFHPHLPLFTECLRHCQRVLWTHGFVHTRTSWNASLYSVLSDFHPHLPLFTECLRHCQRVLWLKALCLRHIHHIQAAP